MTRRASSAMGSILACAALSFGPAAGGCCADPTTIRAGFFITSCIGNTVRVEREFSGVTLDAVTLQGIDDILAEVLVHPDAPYWHPVPEDPADASTNGGAFSIDAAISYEEYTDDPCAMEEFPYRLRFSDPLGRYTSREIEIEFCDRDAVTGFGPVTNLIVPLDPV